MKPVETTEVIIIGAGGAGMMCAIYAGRRGRKVLLLDHAKKIGGKILISGGGRCNFTNIGASPAQYVSENPHFCKSALSRFSPSMFVQMVETHGIDYHEKKLGQLFCDQSAKAIVQMLLTECEWAGAEFRLECKVDNIHKPGPDSAPGVRFRVETEVGYIDGESLVIATGGFSIPKIGATGFGYRIARKFDLNMVETYPALDGFTFTAEQEILFRELAGVSVDCVMTANGKSFRENILFTHAGISGPAALQASLHWREGDTVDVNLLPEKNAEHWLLDRKKFGDQRLLKNALTDLLPSRFVEQFFKMHSHFPAETALSQIPDRVFKMIADSLHHWTLIPKGTVGYSKAEVTRGGVDTSELSSKTLEAVKVPGLYFIGEVVDVTGWLGGYNFQWAWASGHAAGLVV
jgi:predicted Rossmann fold flavoprotein